MRNPLQYQLWTDKKSLTNSQWCLLVTCCCTTLIMCRIRRLGIYLAGSTSASSDWTLLPTWLSWCSHQDTFSSSRPKDFQSTTLPKSGLKLDKKRSCAWNKTNRQSSRCFLELVRYSSASKLLKHKKKKKVRMLLQLVSKNCASKVFHRMTMSMSIVWVAMFKLKLTGSTSMKASHLYLLSKSLFNTWTFLSKSSSLLRSVWKTNQLLT